MVYIAKEVSEAENLFPEYAFLEGAKVFIDNPRFPENGMMLIPLDHRPYYDATWDIRLKGRSPEAICGLMSNLPKDTGFFIVLEEESLRQCVEVKLGAQLVGGQIYLMVDQAHFRPAQIAAGLQVRKLTSEDAEIIANYPEPSVAKHFAMMLGGVRQCQNFGGFLDRKMVTFCNVSLDWEAPEVLWVNTREEYRGKGYAKSIVTEVTKFALEKRQRIYYTVDLENIASSHTALSLGYYRRGQIYTYLLHT